MTPALPKFDAADCGLANAIVGSNLGLTSRVVADGKNLNVCELGLPVLFAALAGAMSSLVSIVASASVPAKVARLAVRLVAIDVAALHSERTRPEKSFCNQGMNVKCLGDAIDAEIDTEVAARGMNECSPDSPGHSPNAPATSITKSWLASDASDATHGKQTRVAVNGPPLFDFIRAFHAEDYAMSNTFKYKALTLKGGY